MIKKIEITIKINKEMVDTLVTHDIKLYGKYKNDNKVVDLILKEIKKLEDINSQIENIIENIKDPLKKSIAVERFGNGKNWTEIALELCYAESSLFGIYSKMLKDPQILKVKELLESI